jgi:hypothetical protein
MAAAIRVDRCEHVWAEVINVRGDSFERTRNCLAKAGYNAEASILKLVTDDKDAWEAYAMVTFEAHTKFIPPDKLRFLQYVTKQNAAYWESQVERGAVLL